MSNLRSLGASPQTGLPTQPKGEPIARYGTYLEAQKAVDYLSDNSFPVQYVTIVGSGLRMVERVTGRLSYPRVAVAGALSGAWFGLFVGLLLSLFGTESAPAIGVFAAMAIGAAFGMMFGVISYAFTRGRRDFTSTSQIVASEYEVLCLAEHTGAAITLLRQLPGGTGRDASDAALQARPSAQAPGYQMPGQPPGGSGTYGQPGVYGQPPAGYQQLPPPTGNPSPGAGPGQPGGPPVPSAWSPTPGGQAPEQQWGTPGQQVPGQAPSGQQVPGQAPSGQQVPAGPPQPALTYGEIVERKRREEREEMERRIRAEAEQRRAGDASGSPAAVSPAAGAGPTVNPDSARTPETTQEPAQEPAREPRSDSE